MITHEVSVRCRNADAKVLGKFRETRCEVFNQRKLHSPVGEDERAALFIKILFQSHRRN